MPNPIGMKRRDFLKQSALATAGTFLGGYAFAQATPGDKQMTVKFGQIADIHMTGFTVRDGLVSPRLPAYACWNLSRRYDLMPCLLPVALKQLQQDFQPQFVIFTGDQAEDGFTKYGKADLEQVKALAEQDAGVPVHFTYGNHDGPQEQWATINGPLNYNFDVGDCRFVVLNTGSMDRAKEQESSLAALQCLQEALKDTKPARVIVFCHQYVYPTGIPGYSMARADAVLQAVEADSRVLAVINGHFHAGMYSEKAGVHYCTAKAFCEPPLCCSTYELGPDELVWNEYKLSPQEKKFVVGETRRLKLRGQ